MVVYVLDSGIDVDNPEFEGRGYSVNGIYRDLEGHGTHVVGIIGSKTYDVAKKAILIAVSIYRKGQLVPADIILAANWIEREVAKTKRKSIINISIGGDELFPELDNILNSLVEIGIFIAVGAGNRKADACSFSPSAAKGPITAGPNV